MMKRIIGLALCLVLLAGMLPAGMAAAAEQTGEETLPAETAGAETEPAPEETEPAAEETEPAPEETEPAAEETEPAPEETEPAAEETEPVPEETESTAQETEPVTEYVETPERMAVTDGDLSTGTPDGTAPVLHGLQLAQYTVTAPGTIEVTVDASDDVSGLNYGWVYFHCEETDKQISVDVRAGEWVWDESTWSDVWVPHPDGKLHGTLEIDQYVQSGTFRVQQISLRDVADNYINYFYLPEGEEYYPDSHNVPLPAEIRAISFQVIDPPAADNTAPVLHGLQLSQHIVAAPGTIEVTVDASDAVSGLNYGWVYFHCEETGKQISVDVRAGEWVWDESTWSDVWVPHPDGKLHGTLEIDQYVQSGTFRVQQISLRDVADNYINYFYLPEGEEYYPDSHNVPLPAEIRNMSISVIQSATPDGTAPVLHGLELSRYTVTAPGTVEVTVDASDAVSGLNYGWVDFLCEETGKRISVDVHAGEWVWDESTWSEVWVPHPDGKLHGTLEIDQYVQSGTFQVPHISLRDVADNHINYFYLPEGEEYYPDSHNVPLPAEIQNIMLEVRNTDADVVTSVSKESFLKDVEAAEDDAYIVADYSGEATLTEELFDAIAGTNKTLDLTSEGITWRFNGADIVEDIKPVDLQVEILPVEEDITDEGGEILETLEENPGVVMKFAENGVLPGKATIQVKVDHAMREYLGRSKGLCVYYYNNLTGELEMVAEDLVVVDESYVEFTITHCSDYVLTHDPDLVQNRMDVTGVDGGEILWVDGAAYIPQTEGDSAYVDLPDGNARVLVRHTMHMGDGEDIHTQYPKGMQVWLLSVNEYGTYDMTPVPELEDILRYAGSSIRITGNKGIRMITSVDKSKKAALVGAGLAGFRLVEYGTVLSWASDLEGGNPLVLGQPYAKHNFAYRRGVADPVFNQTAEDIQYTNVLVGFTNEQCQADIAMRSYMILEDADGEQITIYGGIVYRSIGYIAWQNRNSFKSGNAAYEFVWDIIHHVYGDKYDEEYQG